MDFVDSTLIRFADSSTRAGIFDQETLGQMVAAAYDAVSLAVQGPYSPVFDRITLGLSIAPIGTVEGAVRNEAGAPMADLHIQIGGMSPLLPARVDAIWQGSIVAQIQPVQSRITKVAVRFQIQDIDAAIITADGSLPVDPTLLENARKTVLITEMKASMAQPDLLTDDAFTAWLEEIGVSSVGDLVENHRGTIMPGVVQVALANPRNDRGPSPKSLPIAVAILIRDAGFSVAELLMESKMLREQLVERGIDVPQTSVLPALNPFLVVWAIPIATFDDAGWPGVGGNPADLRADRRQNASTWLGPEGIAIAGVA